MQISLGSLWDEVKNDVALSYFNKVLEATKKEVKAVKMRNVKSY